MTALRTASSDQENLLLYSQSHESDSDPYAEFLEQIENLKCNLIHLSLLELTQFHMALKNCDQPMNFVVVLSFLSREISQKPLKAEGNEVFLQKVRLLAEVYPLIKKKRIMIAYLAANFEF